MSFETGHISARHPLSMTAYLYNVSSIACLPAAGVDVGVEIRCPDDQSAYGADTGGRVQGFLLWLRLWFLWLSGGDIPAIYHSPRLWRMNRQSARMQKCAISSVRCFASFYTLFPRGLSGGQFLERLCALSLMGRVRIYRMRFWGSVLQIRALLICYDHGWWRAPLGILGRVYCGFWPVHLWPDWWSVLRKKHKKIPDVSTRDDNFACRFAAINNNVLLAFRRHC